MRSLYQRLWDLQFGLCWICCKPMTQREASKDRKAATMDHIVPLSRGGVNKPRNKLLAHAKCNGQRHNPQVWTPTSVLRKLAFQRLQDVNSGAVSAPAPRAVSTSAVSQGTGRVSKQRAPAALPEELRASPLRVPIMPRLPNSDVPDWAAILSHRKPKRPALNTGPVQD
jgi:hypothetical protein